LIRIDYIILLFDFGGGEDVEEYLIQPWDNQVQQTGIDLDMWVPPQVDELAEQVINCYDMEVQNKTLITSKSDKGGAIWKIETDKGPRSLKVLHRKPIRSLFSVGAQDYIVKQGGRVPELKMTKEGRLNVEKGGKLWIVTDWIDTLTPAGKDLEGAQALCYGLGEFHQHSKGYIPPIGSQRASRLYRWPAYYRKIIKKIDWFRNVAMVHKELPSSQELLSTLEIFEQQAKDALGLLEKSHYARIVTKGEAHWGLVHQDYGWSNGQLGPGGLWVIDLDGVAFDLPIRDLRKLISSTMDELGKWDVAWIKGMIDAYHQANPLDVETYQTLLIDLAFPNEFYKHINEILYDPLNFISHDLGSIIERLTLMEKTKSLALDELNQDMISFQPGDYESNLDFPSETSEMMQVESIMKKTNKGKLSKLKGVIADKKGPLKVLMICTEKLPVPPVCGGAIQTYIKGISDTLSVHHELTILGTTDPSLPLEEKVDKIRYIRVDGDHVLEIYAEKVIAFLKENSFDLIHVFNRPRLVPLIRDAAPQSRIILSMHNDMFNDDKILPSIALTAINEVEKIITVSDYVGNKIGSLYPQAASKVHTIYSGVDLKRFVPWKTSNSAAQIRKKLRAEYFLQDKKVILFVGRLTPKKGTDLLIRAINEAYSSDKNIALVIVGGTWYSVDTVTDYVAYVRAIAEKAPFPVITTGYVSADLIHEWFWAGDIFVCPSEWQEPLARVHYEAMAAGLPFITTARGGNPEVVIDQNGLIVERPEDPVEFAETLKILLSDLELGQRMGQSGRRLAEERFGWERVAQEVLETWKPNNTNYETNLESDNIELITSKRKGKGKNKSKLKGKEKVKVKGIDGAKSKEFGDLLDSLSNPAMEAGSSIVKVTRDMIFPMSAAHNLLGNISPSEVTRRLITSKMEKNDGINGSSMVRVTREMIRR